MSATFNFQDDFQELLLASMIRKPGEFAFVGPAVKPSYFTGVQATVVAKCIMSYSAKYSRYPGFSALKQVVADEVARLPDADARMAIDYVDKISLAPTEDWEFARENVVRFVRERAVIDAARKTITMLQEGKLPADGFAGLFQEAMQVGQNLDDLGLLFHTDADKVIAQVSDVEYGVATGYAQWDKIWKKGWAPGWLIALLAPPKRFKTGMAINLAMNVVSPSVGEDVLYYACEINQELAMLRALCHLSGLSPDYLYENPDKFKAAVAAKMQHKIAGNLLFKGFPAKSATINDIRAHAKTAINQLGLKPRMIVIDYAETIAPIDKSAPEYRQQSSIYTDARALGKELGCCVVLPDRCNKETVEMPVPDMKGFQGAFEKAGIVDIAIGLCSTAEEHRNNVLRTFVFLNRHGPPMAHHRGKVDPETWRIELCEEVPYEPESTGGRGSSGGGRGGRGRESSHPSFDESGDEQRPKRR